jgi:hypothetical protein
MRREIRIKSEVKKEYDKYEKITQQKDGNEDEKINEEKMDKG